MKSNASRSKNPLGTKLADEYCARHTDMPSASLGKKLVREHPLAFASAELATWAIRHRRGKTGANRKLSAPPATPSLANPLGLPDSHETPFEPFVVDTARDIRALVMSDLHLPYHNLPALTAALEDGRKQEVGAVLLNGDVVDCYQISRFAKNPTKPSLKAEVETVRTFLERVRELFPQARIIWKDGNHDERLEDRLAQHPDIFEVTRESVNWPALLNFVGLRVEYVTDQRPIQLGRLTVVHGHEFPSGMTDPVNPARGLYLRAKENALCGHWHRSSEHSERSINGTLIKCWSLGCLCELHPRFARINKWNHGHGIVELSPVGEFRVWGKTSIDGVIYG